MFNHKGLLGINARNLLYIRPYNFKKAIKLADDKIKTKRFLAARDIPVPKLYGLIKDHKEIEKFDFGSLPNSFVLKPNHGFGGDGIIPIVNKRENYWVTASNKKLTKSDLIEQIQDILDGRFSISNVGDTAFFEQYIIADNHLGQYAYQGLPDIRIVVHNLIPVMAMLRLPTKESEGKANLQLGAVGVGIDIAKGETTHIAYKKKIIDELPDGLGKVRGVKIPHWDEILHIASKCQLITNLGFLAADICIDKNSGPVLLELNARAGLKVQIANLSPLRKRLERIEGIKVTSPAKGIRIAKDMFGNTVEKEIEQISGKQIIGTEENIDIIQKKGTTRLIAKIDTGNEETIIDEKMALELGLIDEVENYDDEKSTLKLKFTLKNQRIQTIVEVAKIPSKKYKIIIGGRDLKNFLIDTNIKKDANVKPRTKKRVSKKSEKNKPTNYYEIDQKLIRIDSKIKLLYHLRPVNLESEKVKFFENFKKNPQFEYPDLKFAPLELIDELQNIKTDDSELGKIFKEKKQEILNKISLLEAIDEDRFLEISIKLFGKPEKQEVEQCKRILEEIDPKKIEKEEKLYNAEEAKEKFEKIFKNYSLKNWKVKIKEEMVADCVAGKNNRLFIKKDSKFSRERIEALIVHEIETHILTAENGKNQPYEIFNRGLANYLITQEGLATYNVEKQRHTPFRNNYKAQALVIAIDKGINSSFVETFEEVLKFGLPIEQAFRCAVKVKRGFSDTSRGGVFTKDYIYFKGYQQIKNFIEHGGQLKDLYIGKINLEDLERVQKIQQLQPPRLLPKWL